MLPMHNSMKKIIFSLAFAFFSLSAFALNWEDFSLSVEPLFGLKAGQVDEFVFLKDSQASSDTLSELNWEIKPEFYYGFKLNGGWKQFFANTRLSFGIPKNTGLMIDSDWHNTSPSEVSAEKAAGHDYKTAYSEHDNHLDYDLNFGFKLGYDFSVKEKYKILPAFAFDYSNIKFTAKNGYGKYGYGTDKTFKTKNGYYAQYQDTENQYRVSYNGMRIATYNRITYFFWLGSDFSADLPKNFEVNTGFFFTPYIYAVSYDRHLTRSIDFADLTIGFFGAFKWNLGATYNITPKHSVSLNAEYLYMRVLRGKDYFKQASSNTYKESSEADGGAGAKYFNLTLSYKFKIL